MRVEGRTRKGNDERWYSAKTGPGGKRAGAGRCRQARVKHDRWRRDAIVRKAGMERGEGTERMKAERRRRYSA
jgi:hypothetical protein